MAPQLRQGLLTVVPSPPHLRQVMATVKNPSCMVCCPVPLQALQVTGLLLSALPVPSQGLHASSRGVVMLLVQPWTASMNEIESGTCTSAPRRGPLRALRETGDEDWGKDE